ncbi:hypothetical protein M432DRAFT_638832 [Thermoascus aurantiacus ATCC 26904]
MASTERRMGGMGYPTRKQSGDKGTRRQDGGTPDLIYASPALQQLLGVRERGAWLPGGRGVDASRGSVLPVSVARPWSCLLGTRESCPRETSDRRRGSRQETTSFAGAVAPANRVPGAEHASPSARLAGRSQLLRRPSQGRTRSRDTISFFTPSDLPPQRAAHKYPRRDSLVYSYPEQMLQSLDRYPPTKRRIRPSSASGIGQRTDHR